MISHNQVYMIIKKLHSSILVQILSHFFFALTQKFRHFLWLFIYTLPHLGSPVIQYHIYASVLFISPKSIKYSLLEYKRYRDI